MNTLSNNALNNELYIQKNQAFENVKRCRNAVELYKRKRDETTAAMFGASAKDLRILHNRHTQIVKVLDEYKSELKGAKQRYALLVRSRNNAIKQGQ